jgi:DNA-binding beta-propeller fold protein YncE
VFHCCLAAGASHAQSTALKLKQTIPLPDVEGRIDHFAFDSSGQRLFVCALGNNTVEVIDVARGERVYSFTGLGSPQGVGYIPDFDRIFIASDRGGICNIYDGKSFRQLNQIDLKNDADNVRYDPAAKQIFVGFGSGGIAIIDAAEGKQIGSIKLTAHPEGFQLEKTGHRIFVNVPNSHQLAVVDREQKKVTATWGTDLAFANFPIALDEANHRLFIGCRMPGKLLAINTDSGEIVAKIDLSGDCDDVFFDTKRHRIYGICGAGKIDVIEQADRNRYKGLAQIGTASGARTGLFVPELDTLFVAVPHRSSQHAEIRAHEAE